MASNSVTAAGVVIWSEFEDDECIPRPLRVVKCSSAYSSLPGNFGGSLQGTRPLNVPRRRSSLGGTSTSTSTTPRAQPHGPFGHLTVHKKRNGMSSILPHDLIDSRDGDRSCLIAQGPSAGGAGELLSSGVSEFLPSVNSRPHPDWRAPTISPYKNSAIPFRPLLPRFSFSDNTICTEKSTILPGRSLLPKFFIRSRKGLDTDSQPAQPLRDLVNHTLIRNRPSSPLPVPPLYYSQKHKSAPHLQSEPSVNCGKENLRRSSTFNSLQGVLRKLSLTRSRSCSHYQEPTTAMDPQLPTPVNTPVPPDNLVPTVSVTAPTPVSHPTDAGPTTANGPGDERIIELSDEAIQQLVDMAHARNALNQIHFLLGHPSMAFDALPGPGQANLQMQSGTVGPLTTTAARASSVSQRILKIFNGFESNPTTRHWQ